MRKADFAVPNAVGKVDDKTDHQPKNHLKPSNGGQKKHLRNTTENAEKGHPGYKGDSKRPLEFRVSMPKNPNAQTDDDED